VCCICWKKDTVLLHEAILSTSKYNPSNLRGHITHVHTHAETPALHSDVSTITNATSIIVSRSKDGMKQNSILNYKNTGTNVASPQIALGFLYNFFNDCNIAIDRANNTHLTSFIDYVVDNGHVLRNRKNELHFSRYKYMKQREMRFSMFIMSLKQCIQYSREYYLKRIMKHTPFCYVSHDGWDSIEHDVLGVSLHLIVPGFWKVIKLAVGLKRIKSKKSVQTAEAILIILSRYKFVYGSLSF
jgi:hypothetical protein